MNTQHLYSPCKFIKSTDLHQKIEVKNRVSRPSRASHRAIFRSRPRYANMDINKVKGHAAGFSAGVMWGLMAPVAKLVLAAGIVSPLMMTGFRMAGAAVLFWAASLFVPHERVPRADLLRLAAAAMLGIVLNQGSYIFGVSLTLPGEASIITTTMPLWVMLLAWLFLREPITLKKAGGIALGGGGALILVLGGVSAATRGESPAVGDLLVLGAQLSYALYLTIFRNFIRKYSVVTLMKWMFTFATIAIAGAWIPQLHAAQWKAVSPTELLGTAYVVVCGTFLAYICIMVAQKNLRPTLVGMYNYVQPVTAMVTAVILGLETFTFVKGVAVVMIFSGVLLVSLSKAKSGERKVESAKEKWI